MLPPHSSWGEVLSTGLQMVTSCCSSVSSPAPDFGIENKTNNFMSLCGFSETQMWFCVLQLAEDNGQVKHWDFVSKSQWRYKSRQ